MIEIDYTTGNRDFAECKILCRVSKIGHSAKNCTRQRFLCRVPATRQTRALGKGLLCRVLDSRQNLYTRHRLPVKRRSVTAFFAERLQLGTRQRFVFFLNFFAECPRSGTRQRFIFLNSLPSVSDLALGKEFFLKQNTLPSVPGTTLGKDLIFFIISLPSAPVDALGKEEFFLKKFKTLGKEVFSLPSARIRHSATRVLNLFLKNSSLPSASTAALDKEIIKKLNICRVPCQGTCQSIFF